MPDVTASTSLPIEVEGVDTVALGVFAGKGIAHDLPGGELQALLDSGEAQAKRGHLALWHGEGRRWIVVGLGPRDLFGQDAAREVAAKVHARAREVGSQALCWELPHHLDDVVARALVEGHVLAGHSFKDGETGPARVVFSDHDDRGAIVRRGAVVAKWANAARRLQETPSNVLTPHGLAERAREDLGLDVEVLDPRELGMGLFSAVAQGSDVPPALLVVRHDGTGSGPWTAWVGKAVTHDTGGLSIKSAAGMEKMKFDMSGGAAVLGALAAVKELELPVRVLGVVGATENTINGSAMKPGDVVTALDGTSVEVTNTDAEGRLVLADCITWALREGASRVVDLATLTGGVVVALGDTYAGFFANDEEWGAEVAIAGARSGEEVWRLPLHRAYAERLKGKWSDLLNSPADKKAHPISGGEFLHHFAGDEVPWAHIDIAGVAYDAARPWNPSKGGTGFGVRLLAELAASSG